MYSNSMGIGNNVGSASESPDIISEVSTCSATESGKSGTWATAVDARKSIQMVTGISSVDPEPFHDQG